MKIKEVLTEEITKVIQNFDPADPTNYDTMSFQRTRADGITRDVPHGSSMHNNLYKQVTGKDAPASATERGMLDYLKGTMKKYQENPPPRGSVIKEPSVQYPQDTIKPVITIDDPDEPELGEAASAAQQAAIAINMKKHHKKPKSQVTELAPSPGGAGPGDYFRVLASAWYNHDISQLADIAKKGGSPMKKIIDAQVAVEKMLQRGVIGSDGKTRKYDIMYNSDFDGVVIQSNDYYEYSDYDDAGNDVDSRTGQPWGPNDYMEFNGNDLDEGMYESAELTEEFNLIESIIGHLAEFNGVDAEVIWEDLESLTDDELYVFAVTSEPIMESQGVAENTTSPAYQRVELYNQGRKAGLSGQGTNPYGDPDDSREAYFWQEGYEDGQTLRSKGVAEATGDQKFDSMMSRMTAEPKYPDKEMPPTSIPELIQWAHENRKKYHEYFAGWARKNGFTNVNDALEWFGDNVDPSNPWGPKDRIDVFGRPAAEELQDAAKHDPKAAELMRVYKCYEEIVFDWPDDYRQMNMKEGMTESEAWQKANNRDKTDGMSRKAVNTYRREHPGSKLQTAVTTKPSKLKKGSKASKRRKSYCSRSRGQMKMHNISCAKTPDKAICKARRRWNC